MYDVLSILLRESKFTPVCVCGEQECYRWRAAAFVGTGWVGSQPDTFQDGVHAGHSAG